MTLSKRKSKLQFETSANVRNRNIMVEVSPFGMRLRLKGTRTTYEVSWEGALWQGIKNEADRQRQEKKAKSPKRRS